LLITVSSLFQYIVPLALLIGSAVSFFRRRRRRRRQQELHRNVAGNPTQDALEKMSWRDFENLAVETFRQRGYRVVERGGDGPDGGVDIELYMGQDKYLVQCKQWKVSKVGVATVRELYGVMTAERAVGGFVVASGQFTEEARSFAEGRSIKLVPAHSLLQMIRHNTGQAISSQPAEEANPLCPKCGSPMVLRVARKGSQACNRFWGCTRFPTCHGVRS
jgi:restriction system protein